LISQQVETWAEKHDVLLDFIEPGKPAQHAYIQRFNCPYRDDVVNFYQFNTLAEVEGIIE
jgi:putative transposase